MVMWLARENAYIREARMPAQVLQIVEAFNLFLEYDPKLRILVEPKPNEPVDSAIICDHRPAIGLGYMTCDPARVGGPLVEKPPAPDLAGLDPSDDMGYALAHDKLWSVHLNDQGGLKFDQDKSFGSTASRAFNQVRARGIWLRPQRNGWARSGSMRTQKQNVSMKAPLQQPRPVQEAAGQGHHA